MQTLDKRTATIITVVLGVLFGCSGILACVGGLLTLAGPSALGAGFRAPWLGGLQGICTAAAFISVPVVFYVLLLQGRTDGNAPKAEVPSMMEDMGTSDMDMNETAGELKAAKAEAKPASSPPPAPAGMADATFIEAPDDPSMKATLVGSGMGPDDDGGDDGE